MIVLSLIRGSMKSIFKFLCIAVLSLNLALPAQAQNQSTSQVSHSSVPTTVSKMNEVTVTAKKENDNSGDEVGNFLPDTQGTKIYKGKKTSVVKLVDAPQVSNSNFRQALVKVPGVILAEESTPLFSLGYRGLNPDRAQFIQVLKDGVPIHADMFGYPEAYFVPPLDSIEKIEVIRGGAGLMFGPQPGGAINFVTPMPAEDTPLRLESSNAFGSHDYFSTYDSLTGKVGKFGYHGYFHERQSSGFRTGNSDYEVISSSVKVTADPTDTSKITMVFDQYNEEHGEPGGLTRAQFDRDATVTIREWDRFRLERYFGSAKYENKLDDATQFEAVVYGGHYRRWSKRQNGGGFGTVTGTTNSISEQDFYNLGFEERLRHDYEFLNGEHTVSFGTHTFMSHSPIIGQTGAQTFSESGIMDTVTVRDTWAFAPFVENLFRWGKFSITPGFRMENIWQRINEKLRRTGRQPDKHKGYDFEPLFGLGMAYEIAQGIEAYSNISQSYRPKLFTQTIPTGATQVINEDLQEGKGVQYDFGFRGKRHPFWNWDIDYFLMSFTNQIGTSGNTVTNGGRAHYQGVEMFQEFDLMGAFDYFKNTNHSQKWGGLAPFFTMTLLDAEYSAGAFKDRAPAYAPQYNLRTGLNYRWRDRAKVSLTGTFLGDHFGDDASSANMTVPSYKVWDLTVEVNLLKNVKNVFDMGLFGGINNLFDEKYFSRVTSGGIDPADGRNIYGGVKVQLG